MNNYSWLQQKLHSIALSNEFMKKAFFDLEQSLFEVKNSEDNHIFVAGLARSGTTIFLNAIYHSDEFASLSYSDMPFIMAPNFWSKFSFSSNSTNYIERAHGDRINVTTNSPEAFEEVFWKTYDENNFDTNEKFKNYVSLILLKNNKKRYLSKNNQNIRRLSTIKEIFPKSQIFIPFRRPLQHTFSLLSQHNRFINFQEEDKFIKKYMDWIGHTEFGKGYKPIFDENLTFHDFLDLNHWLEQWKLVYSKCIDYRELPNVNFICYESLCADDMVWERVLNKAKIMKKYKFNFELSQKKISLSYNQSLLAECEEIYNKLSTLSELKQS